MNELVDDCHDLSKLSMIASVNPWTATVHAQMIESGESLTMAEIRKRFGDPPDNVGAYRRIWTGMKNGWFEKSKYRKDRKYKYKAINANRDPKIDWNKELELKLKLMWPTMGLNCVPEIAPGKSSAVSRRAQKLRLHKPKELKEKNKTPDANIVVSVVKPNAPNSIFQLAEFVK